MKNTIKSALFLFLTAPLVVYAQENKAIDQNLEVVSGQYAECAAYFRLVYHAMVSSNENETANAYRKLEDDAMFYSLLLSNEGRSKDTAVEITNSRIEMSLKMMKREIDNRNENISILINKYQEGCLETIKHPSKQVINALERQVDQLNK